MDRRQPTEGRPQLKICDRTIAGIQPGVAMVRILVLLTWAVLLTASVKAEPPTADVHQIAHAVDEHYNRLRTLRTEFTESYRGAGTERTESGTLSLKKPGKMRWEYRSPREKLFLSDGKNAWFYVPGDRQVRRTTLKKLDDLRSPLAFLLGKTRLEKELQALSFARDIPVTAPDNIMLRGQPAAMADRVSQVLLEINPEKQIIRILIEQVDSSVTEYRFHDLREGVELAEGEFHFAIPPGVELVEGDFGP